MLADAQPLATMHTGFSYRGGIDGLLYTFPLKPSE